MKTYQEFLLFATRRLKLKFAVVEFIIRGFLQKYHLRPRTIECYLFWGQRKSCGEIAKLMKISPSTVSRELQKLEFVCPELFIRGNKSDIPQIPWIFHPTEWEWRTLDEFGLIKEKF